MTGIEFSRKRATSVPCTSPTTTAVPSAAAMPSSGSPSPVSTATMPPSRYIDETERSNSPAMIVMPSASATRPYDEKFCSTSYAFAVRTV